MTTKTDTARHTPGPWKIHGPYSSGFDLHYTVNRTTDTNDSGHFCRIDTMNMTEEAYSIALANAQLIAAAPLLLEAMKSIADPEHCLTEHTVDGLRKLARAAVDRATAQRSHPARAAS